MIILGIDPGIADTGVGVIKVEGNKFDCLFYTSVKTKAGIGLPMRLKSLYDNLLIIIKKYQPELISIEQLFFCNNVKTALVVGQARGVSVLAAENSGVRVVEYTPLQIKQAVSAYGKASKQQVQKMVMTILGLKEIPKPDDAADALAAAICAANNS